MSLRFLAPTFLIIIAGIVPWLFELLDVGDWTMEFELYRTMMIVGCAVLAMLAALRDRVGRKANDEVTFQDNQAVKKVEELQIKCDSLEQRVAELNLAYNDASQQLERLATEEKSKASSMADQEVVHFLSLLQSRGRFVDFLMDDVTQYSDQQVGAAARVVHQGCKAVVRDYFDIQPISDETEGVVLTLENDYDAKRFRVLGDGAGDPPFRGKVLHRGWLTPTVNLPDPVEVETSSIASGIIAPVEIELQ